MAHVKPYPVMKNSGIPWLGRLPEHWAVRKVRDVARVINGFPFDAERFSTSTGYPLVRIRDLNKRQTATRYDGPFVELARVDPGEVLIGMDGEFNVGTWRGDSPALLNQRMCCIRSTDPTIERFLAFVLPQPLKEINDITWSTTVKHLSSGQVERISFGWPPLHEQAAIVRYLDHADRQIQRCIRAKQKLMKLLEEQKQAMIHRAVTRGLDSNVRFKPSGVEWLGDVPVHWDVRRLKDVSPEITVGVVVNPSSYFAEDGVPILLGNNVRAGRFRTSNVRRITQESNKKLVKSRLNQGDVVVVRVGAPGVAAVVPPELDGCNCASMMIVRRGKASEPLWIEYLFNSPVMRSQIDMVKYGAAQKQFNISHAVEFWAILPPIDEQRAILRRTSDALAQTDAAIVGAESAIGLLCEYRIRLIADVVTGKVDVRDAAAGLPGEVEESAPLADVAALTEIEQPASGDLDLVPEETDA